LSLYLSLPLLALRAREDASEAALSQEQVIRDGIQLNEAITGDRGAIFPRACWMNFQAIVSKRIGWRYVSRRTRAWLKTKNPSSSDSDAASA
jgi:ATP-dependent DNA ligase